MSATFWVGWLVVAGLVMGPATSYAEPPSADGTDGKSAERQRREQYERQTEQALEQLKLVDPAAYAGQKRLYERQKEHARILTAVAEETMDAATARRQLYPLVQAEVEDELKGIDIQIAWAKGRVEELERLKQEPERVVQERINQRLEGTRPHEREGR